jgi:hypothetical protein
MSDTKHNHANGLFCDDCPDALRRNLKRLLALHQWAPIDSTDDCMCGWVMPFEETDQHAAHVADVIAAELTRLGWTRSADLGT